MATQIHDAFPDLPDKFLGGELDELTHGIYRWRSIKNLRSKGRIPECCFLKVSPRKILIYRDKFLEWAQNYATNIGSNSCQD